MSPATLAGGQTAWATVDSPWATMADPDKMSRAVDGVRRLNPSLVLSSHLPPIHRGVDVVLKTIEAVAHADPAPALTQAELQALLDQFEPAS